jgi:nucleoside-diphosphate-sugar epimerase
MLKSAHSRLVNPPYLYGPLIDGFSLTPGDYYALSTDLYIARLLKSDGVWPESPVYADIRDVAKAHVLALKSPKTSEPGIGRKRLIFSALYDWDDNAIVDIIGQKRPELKDRLLTAPAPTRAYTKIPFDVDRVEKVLGFKKDDYHSFEDTVLGTVDSILKLEREWASKGFGPIDYPNN